MKNSTRYSSQAGLAALLTWSKQAEIWETATQTVQIPQKTVKYTPLAKLEMGLVAILMGCKGVVELNTRLQPDQGLLGVIHQSECVDQSTLSRTLNACQPRNLAEMRAGLKSVLRQFGGAYQHAYDQELLLLDIDMTGLVGGKQGEGVTKGYFGRERGRRGRQVGRVLATQYNEIIWDQLYPGTKQLDQNYPELVQAGLATLDIAPAQHAQVVIRVDGGGGKDADINWTLAQGLLFVTKTHSWQRAHKLARQTTEWLKDPRVPDRWLAWPAHPHAYDQPCLQMLQKSRKKNGAWQYRVIVTNLSAAQVCWLAGATAIPEDHPAFLAVFSQAYDLRSGGVETSYRNSKQALQIEHRHKRRFCAQEMLLLLAQLAYNLLTWFAAQVTPPNAPWQKFGFLRFQRDVLGIPGKLTFTPDLRVQTFWFSTQHVFAKAFCNALKPIFPDELLLRLRQI